MKFKHLILGLILTLVLIVGGCTPTDPLDTLYVQENHVTNLNAATATITSLNAPTATVGSLNAGSITSPSLQEDNLGNVAGCKYEYGGAVTLAKSSHVATPVGNVGVLGWSGNHRFANFRVEDYEGNTLYSDDFTADALNALPAGWAQWDNAGGAFADWQVKASATHPSGRMVEQQSLGNWDTQCYLTGWTPPADNKYVIEVDIEEHLGHPNWLMGTTLYQSAPGTFRILWYDWNSALGWGSYGAPADTYRLTDVVSAQDTWYTLRLVVDGEQAWGYIKTLAESEFHWWLTVSWGKTLSMFEAPGPLSRPVAGTVKMLYFARGQWQDMTINVYYDGDAIPTLSMPLMAFFNSSEAGAEWATRFVGVNETPRGSAYRYIDIPYTDGIKIEVVNDTDTDCAFWWQVGYLDATPSGLGRYGRLRGIYADNSVAPLAWDTVASIVGHGVLYSTYFHGYSTDSMGFLEGNIRISTEGSGRPILEGSGAEDYPLYAFYFQGPIPRCTDFIGVVNKTDVVGNHQVGFYRMFIRDPIVFDMSMTILWQNGQEQQFVPVVNTRMRTCVLYYTDN